MDYEPPPPQKVTPEELATGRRLPRWALPVALPLGALALLLALRMLRSEPPPPMVQSPVVPEAAPPAVAAPTVSVQTGASLDGTSSSAEAIDFVKNHTLDQERGPIGQWLEYSFVSPGFSSKWSAQAEPGGLWLVKYVVYSESDGKIRVQYRFQADLPGQTLRGMDQPAQDLLSGGKASPR